MTTSSETRTFPFAGGQGRRLVRLSSEIQQRRSMRQEAISCTSSCYCFKLPCFVNLSASQFIGSNNKVADFWRRSDLVSPKKKLRIQTYLYKFVKNSVATVPCQPNTGSISQYNWTDLISFLIFILWFLILYCPLSFCGKKLLSIKSHFYQPQSIKWDNFKTSTITNHDTKFG